MSKNSQHVIISEFEEIDDLLKSLNKEDKKSIEWSDWDESINQKQANTMGYTQAKFHYQKLLQDLKEDILNLSERKKRENLGLTIPKLLIRYKKLDPEWRAFVRGKLQLVSDDDDSAKLRGNQADEELFEKFGEFSLLEDEEHKNEIINTFNGHLSEVEKLYQEIPSEPASY